MVDPIIPAVTEKLVETAAKVVPVYKEEFQPAARELGKALTVVGKAINVALFPLTATVWGYEQIAGYLGPRLEQKLSGVAPEKIATPPSNVAGPALEALRFTSDMPDLREMYANLLATAMNADTAYEAHPAFVEIIKQLTSDEARIIEVLADGRYRPVIHVFIKEIGAVGKRLVTPCQSLIDEEAGLSKPYMVPSYVDNLSRLGLVELGQLGHTLTAPGIYDSLLASEPNREATCTAQRDRGKGSGR